MLYWLFTLMLSGVFSQTHAQYPCVFVHKDAKYLSNRFHVRPASPHTDTRVCGDKHTSLNVIHHTLSSISADMSLKFVACDRTFELLVF